MKDPMQTIQTLIARALVRLAIAAAPAGMASKLRAVVDARGGPGAPE